MKRMQGFTLIEMIAVIVMVGILSVTVVVYFPSQQTFNIAAYAEELKRDIRYTQTLAMSLNSSYTINISSSNYSITPNPPQGAYTVILPTGLSLTGASITFDAEGKPSNVSLVSLILSAGTQSKTLTVAPETGFVNG